MPVTTCPFCGVVTELPHDTQESCIEALQAEIARVRGILDHSFPVAPAPRPPDDTAEPE